MSTREMMDDGPELARFERAFHEDMLARSVDQRRENIYSYKGEECGACMGAHLGRFFYEHEDWGVTIFPQDEEPVENEIVQEIVDPDMEALHNDMTVQRNEWEAQGRHVFDWSDPNDRLSFAMDFTAEHNKDFSPPIHFQDGVEGLSRYLGLDRDNEELFHKILAVYTGTDPWGERTWNQPYKLSPAKTIVWAYRDLLHYHRHYRERQWDVWEGWNEEMVFDRFLQDVHTKAHGVGWELWTEDQIKEAENYSEDEE